MNITITSNIWEIKSRQEKRLNSIARNVNYAGYEYCDVVAKQMKKILIRRGNVFRGESGGLLGSIRARRIRSNQSAVFMKKSGFYLDNMKPHRVWLKKGRLIHKWALAKGNFSVKSQAAKQGFIWVRPSPFIRDAFVESRRLLPSIIKNRVRIGVSSR